MSAADILEILITANISASCVIAALIVVRNPLRQLVGAQATYWSWLAVPLVVLASLAPARIINVDAVSADAPTIQAPALSAMEAPPLMSTVPIDRSVKPPLSADTSELSADVAIDWAPALVLVWMLVASGALTWLLLRQLFAFRALGELKRISPHIFRSGHVNFGPAVVGVFSPRVVLPANFESEFDEIERKVVIAHEEAHLRGRHTVVKALTQIAVCLNWFNPLVHLAARCIAMDQELTSDASVVRRYPEHRKAYAYVLVRRQIGLRAPMACYWPAPSKEALKVRITEIKRGVVGNNQRAIGGGLLMLAAVCAAGVAWATKPPEARIAELASEQRAGIGSGTAQGPDDKSEAHQAPLQYVRFEQEAPNVVTQPRRLEPHALSAMSFVIVGTVEKIEFRERDYVMFVRGAHMAMPNYKNTTWGSQPVTEVWELSPVNYFGDAEARSALTRQFLNKQVRATGFSATPALCAPKCRMSAQSLERVEPTLLPAISSNASFSLTDLATRYDINDVATFRGKVERIEFSDRMFDAYVRSEPRGGAPGAVYQIRAESRFPTGQVEQLLLDKTIVAAGWPGRAKDGTVCETGCGLYATDIELPDGSKLTPNGATLVSRPPVNAEFHDEPGTLPTIMPGLFERIEVMELFDLSDPIIMEGVVVGQTPAELLVEASHVYPASTKGAASGTMWRVVKQSGSRMSFENEVGRSIELRGFNAKSKSCQPSCLMSDGPSW